MTNKEFTFGTIGTVLGGFLVWLLTNYLSSTAKLTAIESSNIQIKELMDEVLALKLEIRSAQKEMENSQSVVLEKLKGIEKIENEIIQRNQTIEELDVITALSGKDVEIENFLQNYLTAKGERFIMKRVQDLTSDMEWYDIVANQVFNFRIDCEYRFVLDNYKYYYFHSVSHKELSGLLLSDDSGNINGINYYSVSTRSPSQLIFKNYLFDQTSPPNDLSNEENLDKDETEMKTESNYSEDFLLGKLQIRCEI